MNKTGGFPGLACGASKDVKRRSRISRPLALKQETSLARDMRLVFVDQESLPFPCLHGSQKLRAGRMSIPLATQPTGSSLTNLLHDKSFKRWD